MRRLVVVASAVVIAAVAILDLWLSRDTAPELPPLRPLEQPTHSYPPIPETSTKPKPYVDDSTIDVREN